MRPSILAAAFLLFGGASASADDKPEPRYKGKPLAYWVERLCSAESDPLQAEAAQAIMAFGTDALPAIREFEAMLDDRSPVFREHAEAILVSFGKYAEPILPGLVATLKAGKSKDPALTMTIIGAIGPGAKEAVPVLLTQLESKDRDMARIAARTLSEIGPGAKDAVPRIVRMIADSRKIDDEERPGRSDAISLLNCLGGFGAAAVEPLTGLVADQEDGFRVSAMRQLARIGPPAKPALTTLVPLMKAESPHRVRLDAAQAVWGIDRDKAALETMKELLAALDPPENPNTPPTRSYVAYQAADALCELGEVAKPYLPELKDFVAGLSGRNSASHLQLAENVRALELGVKPRKIVSPQPMRGNANPFGNPAIRGGGVDPNGRGGGRPVQGR